MEVGARDRCGGGLAATESRIISGTGLTGIDGVQRSAQATRGRAHIAANVTTSTWATSFLTRNRGSGSKMQQNQNFPWRLLRDIDGKDLIEYHEGNIPIIISAPHGGKLEIGGSLASRSCRCATATPTSAIRPRIALRSSENATRVVTASLCQ